MRIAWAFLVVVAAAGPALAQPYPDLIVPEARPEIWPLLKRPEAPRPTWNVDGYQKRVEAFDHEGQKSAAEVARTYDAAGHLTSVRKTVAGKLERGSTMSYDAKGHVSQRIDEYSTGSKYTYDFSYDAAGRLAKVSDVGPDRPAQETVLTYDAAGNLASRAETSGGKTGSNRFVRSKHGTLVDITVDSPDGKHLFLYDGDEDARGNVIHVKTGAWISGEDVKATWDAKHRMTSITSTRDKVTEVIKVSYDAKGHVVSEHEDFGGGGGGHGFNSKADATYSYDAKGRLTQVKRHTEGYPPMNRTDIVTYTY